VLKKKREGTAFRVFSVAGWPFRRRSTSTDPSPETDEPPRDARPLPSPHFRRWRRRQPAARRFSFPDRRRKATTWWRWCCAVAWKRRGATAMLRQRRGFDLRPNGQFSDKVTFLPNSISLFPDLHVPNLVLHACFVDRFCDRRAKPPVAVTVSGGSPVPACRPPQQVAVVVVVLLARVPSVHSGLEWEDFGPNQDSVNLSQSWSNGSNPVKSGNRLWRRLVMQKRIQRRVRILKRVSRV
jgi:hypothetical protein